jgi:hypothetical protein
VISNIGIDSDEHYAYFLMRPARAPPDHLLTTHCQQAGTILSVLHVALRRNVLQQRIWTFIATSSVQTSPQLVAKVAPCTPGCEDHVDLLPIRFELVAVATRSVLRPPASRQGWPWRWVRTANSLRPHHGGIPPP